MELQVQEQNWSQRWEDKEKQLQESRNIHLALEAEIQSLRLELSEQQQARAAAEEKFLAELSGRAVTAAEKSWSICRKRMADYRF